MNSVLRSRRGRLVAAVQHGAYLVPARAAALDAHHLPSEVRGMGFGALATVNGLGELVSSAVVGVLWVVSPTWGMGFVIAASLIGAAVILTTHPKPAGAESSM